MALISLGESKWRMLRRALQKRRVRFEDVRNMHRLDRKHFDRLVERGLLAAVGKGRYEVTHRGRASADLGFYGV